MTLRDFLKQEDCLVEFLENVVKYSSSNTKDILKKLDQKAEKYVIIEAFSWGETPERAGFWSKIDDELNSACKGDDSATTSCSSSEAEKPGEEQQETTKDHGVDSLKIHSLENAIKYKSITGATDTYITEIARHFYDFLKNG